MDLDDLNEVNNQQGANALHVGMARIIQSETDSVFVSRQIDFPQPRSDFFRQNPEAIRLWAKCFAPGPGVSVVHVQQSGLISSLYCFPAQQPFSGLRNF
jgi:hypothetical protein